MGCDSMGFDVKYQKESSNDGLEMFLAEIKNSAEITEKEMIKAAGERAKAEVEKQLQGIKRFNIDRKGRPALADDVKLSVRKNKWGQLTAQVKGGKLTGTLWHIVNDGNLHSRPTKFLDRALNNLDNAIDGLWEKVGAIMK